jgi:DNA-binding MarR family transcriptional regulator
LAEYRPNPAHQRAKLLAATEEGLAAIRRIQPGHQEFARRLSEQLGQERFAEVAVALEQLVEALDKLA